MSITEIIAIIAVGFSIAYMMRMKAKMDESIMEMKRASCRMRQLEEEIAELSEDRETRYSLEFVDS